MGKLTRMQFGSVKNRLNILWLGQLARRLCSAREGFRTASFKHQHLFASALVLNLGCISADAADTFYKGSNIGMAAWEMPYEIQYVHNGQSDLDADAISLAQRHAKVITAAIADGGVDASQIDMSVVFADAFTDADSGPIPWPPLGETMISPWLAMTKKGSDTIRLTLFVSDLRVIADSALRARGAAPTSYQTGPEWAVMPYTCLAQATEEYVTQVTSERISEQIKISTDCVPKSFVSHLLWLFQSAPQNFFAPFEISVMGRIETERHESMKFYERLYVGLIRSGISALNHEAGTELTWWHKALREATS